MLRGGGNVAGCRCWGLRALASRDSEDALLATIKEEAVLRACLASAEASIDVARAKVACMMYTSAAIEEERTSSALFICTNGYGTENATIAAHRTDPEWVLDSRASKLVAQ